MKWLDRLDRKYGRYAIKNLMLYIIIGNLAVFLMGLISPAIWSRLALVPPYVLRGEVWRLVSYIFIPPSSSPIFILFALYFYYMIGNSLEHEWGSFKFNAYYFIGMAGTTAAAFLTRAGTTALYLNLSLFLAFATLFPNYEILLFFLIPVKIKYLAWLDIAFILITVAMSPLPAKIAAVVSLLNYLLFFGGDMMGWIRMKRQVYYNRKRFFKEIRGSRKP